MTDGEFWGVDNIEVQLTLLPPEFHDYSIGSTVSDDVRAARDEGLWSFSVPAGGLSLYMDWQSCFFEQRAQVLDSAGLAVSIPGRITKCDERLFDLPEGDYTLRVWSVNPSAVGTYEFKVASQ